MTEYLPTEILSDTLPFPLEHLHAFFNRPSKGHADLHVEQSETKIIYWFVF